MLFCESSQVGVWRIAFVSDMCSKEAGVWTQHTFRAHSVCVLNDLMGAQMITTRLFRTIGVIHDHNIESHLVVAKNLPSPFEQCGCIRTIEDSATHRPQSNQHRSHPRGVIGRKGHHRIRGDCERFQWLDLVDLDVEILLRFCRDETVPSKVSLERFCRSFQGLAGRIEIQDGCANHAIGWAAREQMLQVQMVSVGMGLQAIPHLIQRAAVHVRRRHNVGAKINQQIIIDQRSGPFPKTRPA